MGLKGNLKKGLGRNFSKILALSVLSILIVSFPILVYFRRMLFSVGVSLSALALGGMFISFVNIKPFKELHTPEEFYDESERVIKKSKRICIISTTPGIILASEYDPDRFPWRHRKYKGRKRYFDSLLKASQDHFVGGAKEKGVKVRYFFDKKNTANILREYEEQNCEKYIEKGKKILEKFLKETNSNFEIRCGEIPTIPTREGVDFRRITIIGDQYIVKSERDKDTQKIRHGTSEKNKDEALELINKFDKQLWENGEEVKDVSFIDRLMREEDSRETSRS